VREGGDVSDGHTTPDTAATETRVGQHRGWDFALIVLTVGLLAALGVQSIVGTAYVWWAQRTVPTWEQTGYAGFVDAMNLVAAPIVIALVVVAGLCVPKRLFSRRVLVALSGAMAAIGLLAWALAGSLATGVAGWLIAAGAIQVAVVVMTIAGSGGLSYLREGRLTRVGSGLLHLGFIVLGYIVVALQDSGWMLPAFAACFVLTLGGSALTFYARPLPKVREDRDPAARDSA
jgi:hypothetical protein